MKQLNSEFCLSTSSLHTKNLCDLFKKLQHKNQVNNQEKSSKLLPGQFLTSTKAKNQILDETKIQKIA